MQTPGTPPPPAVECDRIHPGLAVADVSEAIAFYTNKLGFRLAFTYDDPPTFAGLNLGDVQLFLSEATPRPSSETAAVYFVVADPDALYEFHRAAGVHVVQPIDDRPYGMRDYVVRDLDGYNLTFGCHAFASEPAISVERVDVPVRLEKRLAALLHDLAAHKRMSLSSCLEEILLHTNDGVGPHTKATLRHIEELKQKHGIDYDTHASYRFSER